MCTVQARLPFGGVKISGGRVKLGRIDGQEESAAARRPIVPPAGPFRPFVSYTVRRSGRAGYESNRRSNIPSLLLVNTSRRAIEKSPLVSRINE